MTSLGWRQVLFYVVQNLSLSPVCPVAPAFISCWQLIVRHFACGDEDDVMLLASPTLTFFPD